MSANSAPQMLFLKEEYTLRFLNFLTISLCSSSANCSFNILLLSLADSSTGPADVFYQKFYKPLKQNIFYFHHILHF